MAYLGLRPLEEQHDEQAGVGAEIQLRERLQGDLRPVLPDFEELRAERGADQAAADEVVPGDAVRLPVVDPAVLHLRDRHDGERAHAADKERAVLQPGHKLSHGGTGLKKIVQIPIAQI